MLLDDEICDEKVDLKYYILWGLKYWRFGVERGLL